MAMANYTTSATCLLYRPALNPARRQEPVRTVMTEIEMDGAEVLSDTPYPLGIELEAAVEGFAMDPLPARIVESQANLGDGYPLRLKLLKGSWPYQVFSALTTLNVADTPPVTPVCLRTLGLSLPCGLADVDAAFAERVRKVHPDRGGDVEQFVKLRAAYRAARRLLEGRP